MTPQEINQSIAEHLGWTRFSISTKIKSGKQLLGSHDFLAGTPPIDKDKPEDDQAFEAVPDYFKDLNAMHEAVKLINNSIDSKRYGQEISSLVLGMSSSEGLNINNWCIMRLANATSQQRAEAFLRTFGKWKE